jgi:hypothetical protein
VSPTTVEADKLLCNGELEVRFSEEPSVVTLELETLRDKGEPAGLL